MILRILFTIFILTITLVASSDNCKIPKNLLPFTKKIPAKSLLEFSDIKRNINHIKSLCVYKVSFTEGHYNWKMLLIHNTQSSKGPFWFLPHDDENSAFDSAVYAVKNYGGGFLSVVANDKRHFNGQDPNRNFGENKQTTKVCSQQKYPAPLFSKRVFSIINTYKDKNIPYLALHSNSDGWAGNGGKGSISILKSSSSVQSYPSENVLTGNSKSIYDEDSLIYIAGTESSPPRQKLKNLMNLDIHTKYEVVNKANNDCSMSNYVVLNKGGDYYNIETEHGDSHSQKILIKKLMHILKIKPITSDSNGIANLFKDLVNR